MIVMNDGKYSIVMYRNRLVLMHRIERPEINSHSDIEVGEAFCRLDGVWEVRRAEQKGQIMVRITDSPNEALKVLWEQRTTMHWGYYQ